ncbi:MULTISPECIES: hypothetical protein [Pseudomonas]|jgi:hypothetical protein|uniref:hypothetical protein n=1 Tax=Pseudomonas TaxID=286 RepID=UPI0011CDF35F|nr:hypothetical protein [Pseudomonas frederiksbergensis]
MATRIFFRGDSRAPYGQHSIFALGFSRRDLTAPSPVYRATPNYAGDIEPDSAVCVSARISASALFPLDVAVARTYIYAVALDTSAVTNTHKRQVEDGLAGVAVSGVNALWPLFAQELAIPEIPANQIIASVACDRVWNGADWSAGAVYTLHSPVATNPACTVNAQFRDAAVSFLMAEINLGNNNTPLMGNGYHPVN